MKKKIILIVLILLYSSAYSSEKVVLTFKPYQKAVYNVYLQNSLIQPDGWSYSKEAPVIIEYQGASSDSFTLLFSEVIPDKKPPHDLRSIEVKFTPGGLESTESIYSIPDGVGVTDVLFNYPMQNINRSYEIGESYSYRIDLPLQVIYDTDVNGEKELISVDVVQKIAGIEKILGFKCAKILYSVDYVFKREDNPDLDYEINGTLFFALKEGMIVYDVATGTRYVMKNGEKKRMFSTKKVRLVTYDSL